MTDQLRSQPMSKHTQSSPVSDNQPFDDTRKLTMALGEMSRAERENIELGRRLEAAEAYIEELKAELRAQAATAQVPPNTTGGALCPKPPCTAFPDCGCVAQPDAAATAQPKSLDRNKIAEAICDPGFLGHFHASGSTGGIFRYKYEQIADRVIAAISNDAAQPDAAATAQTPFCTCPCSCDETPHDGSKCPVHDTVTDWEDVEQRTNIRAPAQPDAAATPKATADERWCLANNISCNDPTVAQPSCIFEVRNMDGSIAMSGTSRAWCRVHGGFDCAPIPSAEGN